MGEKIKYCDGKKLKELILASTEWVNENKTMLNNLNVFPVPDGDTGINMSLTLQGAANKIRDMNGNLSRIADTVAEATLMEARGCSGTILSQWFKGFAQSVKGKQGINSLELAVAFQKAAETAYQAVENPVEGTILTVVRESADKALQLAKKEADLIRLFEEILITAKQSLAKTPDLLPVLKDAGVVDAGAQGFVFMLEAMLNNLQGRKPELPKIISVQGVFDTIKTKKENLVNKYCVECVIKGGDSRLDEIKAKLDEYGGSLIIAKSAGLLKIHLHTNYPKKVLQYCSSFGNLLQPKVDNMKKQRKKYLSSIENTSKKKQIGIVAVTLGKGLVEIFRSMGADVVIAGRRTMNPCTKDLIKSIKRIKAENIIILPNDPNVFPVAEEAKKISTNTYVIPSKTIPQGIAALLAFNAEADLITNRENMNKALKKVKTGITTYATDQRKFGEIEFKKGNILSFYEKEIKIVGKDVQETTLNLIDKMIAKDDKLISIFYGKKIKAKEVKKLVERIKSQHPELEVQFYYGGQPNYYYIISVE